MFRRAFGKTRAQQRFLGKRPRYISVRRKSTRRGKDDDPYTAMFQNKPVVPAVKNATKSLKPSATNPNNLSPALLKREQRIRKTVLFGKRHYWKIMSASFAGTLGTLGVLLVFDNVRTRFKVWAPQAGLVVEHFGEMIFGMEFEKPQSIETGKLIPLKYEKPAKALDLTKPLSEQTAHPLSEPSPSTPKLSKKATEPETSIAGTPKSSEKATEPETSTSIPEATYVETNVNFTAPPPPILPNSQSEGIVRLEIPTEEDLAALGDSLENVAQNLWTVLPKISNAKLVTSQEPQLDKPQTLKPEGVLPKEEISQPKKPITTIATEEDSKKPITIVATEEVSTESKSKEIDLVSVPNTEDVLKEESRLKYLRNQMFLLEARKEAKEKAEIAKQKEKLKILKAKLESSSAQEKSLRSQLERSKEEISIMKMNLDERETYLRDNLQLLQEGRQIYNETIAAYAELADEMKQANADALADMNVTSRQRIKQLDILDTEIKAIENIIDWYGRNKTKNRKDVLMSLGVMQLEQHVKNGSAFERELSFIELASEKNSVITAVCSAIPPKVRQAGVATKAQLISKWDKTEKSVRQAALTPHPLNSLWSSIIAKVFGFFLLPERSNKEGNDPQSRISRVGFFLDEGDLRGAVDEVMALEGLAQTVSSDWLVLARNRLLVSEVLGLIRADLVRRHMEP